MPEPAYTSQDLALFTDLARAAEAVGVEPCLIGAGAIQLGLDRQWTVRLTRMTHDWDFAVRVESWKEFEALAFQLGTPSGRFRRGAEPHRFHHEEGGVLDVLPYGGVELRAGQLRWPGGTVMSTAGFGALDRHHAVGELGSVELRAATLPAVVGLKLLAYLDRRPGIVRDIQDVHHLLREAEGCVADERVYAEGVARLRSEEVTLGEIGAYLLGRDVGVTFQLPALTPILELLEAVGEEGESTVADVLRGSAASGATRARVIERLGAFRLGIVDRP